MGSRALIDNIEIQVLVDNATDILSTIPAYAESEFTYLERHGMREYPVTRSAAPVTAFPFLSRLLGERASTQFFSTAGRRNMRLSAIQEAWRSVWGSGPERSTVPRTLGSCRRNAEGAGPRS